MTNDTTLVAHTPGSEVNAFLIGITYIALSLFATKQSFTTITEAQWASLQKDSRLVPLSLRDHNL